MIIDLILYLFLQIILQVLDLLPPMTDIPTDFSNAINTFIPIISQLNQIMPVSTIITIFLLYLTIEGGLLLFKMFNWILNKLRGSG